jgi:hypothetical protein
MILEIPQSTLESWEKTAAEMRQGNISEEKITTWFEYCKKWELGNLNSPKVDDSSNSKGMTVQVMGGEDGKALTVFTHADGFRCLKILNSHDAHDSSDTEKLDSDLSNF